MVFSYWNHIGYSGSPQMRNEKFFDDFKNLLLKKLF